MDNPDGPVSRVGRTFWTVWTYISEAVNRFLRPEPTNTQSSDPVASRQSADNNEPANSGHPEGDTCGGGVDEEQSFVKASLLSSSRPVVAWESCTTEINLGPVEESTEYKSQLSEEREEQFDKTRNDDVELLVAKDASTKEDKEDDSNWKLYSHGQSETAENHEHEEHVKVGPLNPAEDTMSEDIEGVGSKAGAEDETQEALDDDQKMDETMRKMQIKGEEDKMHHEDERDLDAEDTEVTLDPTTDLSLENEESMHTEESRQQRDEADTAVMYNEAGNGGGVLQMVPENESKYDEGAKEDGNVFSVNEELSDVEEDPSVATLEDELQITFKNRVSVSEDDGQKQVIAQSSESDKAEDEREKEDENTLDMKEQSEEENRSEVADNKEVDEEPEQKEDIKTISENSQSMFAEDVDQFDKTRNDDVELLVAEDGIAKEDKEDDSNWKLYSHGQSETAENHEHEEHVKVGPLNPAEDTMSEDIEGVGSKAGAEDETQEALDDDQKMDETMRNMQIKGEEDKMHHEDERDLDADDTEVTLDPTTDLSLENEESMHTEESRQQRDEADTAVMYNEAGNGGGVLQMVPENESKYDEGAKEDGNVFSVNEELSDVEEDPSVATLEDELQITFKNRVSVSEDDGQKQVIAQSSESDKAEDEREKEDENTLDMKEQSEEENRSEVADNKEVDEEPEQKEDIKTISENSQSIFAEDVDQFGQTRNDGVELLVAEDASIKEDKEEGNSNWKLYTHGQGETPENYKEHAKIGSLNLTEDAMSEDKEGDVRKAGAEDETQEALDDAQEMDGGQSGEENNKIADSQEVDEEPEQEEEDIKTIPEDSHCIFTEDVRHNEEAVQNGEAKLHTVEIADDEKEDVAEVGTKTIQIVDVDVDGEEIVEKSCATTADISVVDRLCNEDQVGEERLSCEKQDVRESYMEIACTATSVTVKPIGETGQEIGGELKNIPPRICEGPVVVSQGLTSPTSEETQEGVPGYNNEPEPDENTTQRLLEVGDGNGKEIHATQLPEEEESKEPESTQNSGTRGDYLTLGEHMEEERENTEDINKGQTGVLHLADAGLPQKTERLLVEPASEEPGHLFEEEEATLLEISMKMGIEHLQNDFETHAGVTDETEKTTKGLQGALVEFETDEGLSDSKDSAEGNCETTGGVASEDLMVGFTDEIKVQTMNQTNFFQESADTMNFEQNSNTTHSFLEDITESGFMKESVETEPKLLEDSTVEMQEAGIDMEDPGYGAEEEEVEVEMQNNNKQMEFFNPEVAGMATHLTTENNATILFGESKLSRPDESLETKNLPSDKAFEVSREEILTDTEAADTLLTIESRPKDLTLISVVESEGSYAEETQSSVSRGQDVIEEEILNLWIQTALSKDNNGVEQQEESEPGQQIETKMEPSHEEQDELALVQVEREKEQLVESNSGESGLFTDTEMSSSTTESGFLDQSVSEWGTNHSDAGLFQGSFDKLPSLSESPDSELSEQQHKPESVEPGQSDVTGDESIVEAGFHHDSGARSSETEHQIQELEKWQERTDEEQVESAATKTESQETTDADVMGLAKRTDWEDTEGTDTEAKVESSLKDEETGVEDAPLEVTVSDSADEIKDAESEQSGSGSEASLQDEVMLMASQEYACTDSKKLLKAPSLDKPQPRWSEDYTESSPELNRAEEAEQTETEYENQMEVDASTLDFTPQKSRIAVKNPRVRPPKDPRSLLHMPSVDPTPSSRLPVKVPVGLPLGGMGIGIKLPGLGGGFPVLKKTQRGVREEKSSDTLSQEPETKSEEKRDTPKQDEAQHRPKWMPPKQPGFGNPLMSELKSKLKKTTEE